MNETEQRVRRYAWAMLLNGAESTVEDDIDEDGELLSDEEHEAAVELAMGVIRNLRETHLQGGRS